MCDLSIVLVPGAFGLPEFYAPIAHAVASHGHSIQVLSLPTIPHYNSTLGTPPPMSADAAYIARIVSQLADEDKDILLISHSYGGVPMSESVKGLSKKERKKKGKKGGIVRLAYLTSIVPEVGKSVTDTFAGVPVGQQLGLGVDELGWLYQANVTRNAAIVFSDLPSTEAVAWAERFYRQSAVSYAGPLTYAGYADVPVSYLVCERDLVIPATLQRGMIAMIERVAGRKVDVESIDTGHVPVASQPDLVVDWILRVVKKASR